MGRIIIDRDLLGTRCVHNVKMDKIEMQSFEWKLTKTFCYSLCFNITYMELDQNVFNSLKQNTLMLTCFKFKLPTT